MEYELFSRRQKPLRGEVSDVYQYETIPRELRVQIFFIWRKVWGEVYYNSFGQLDGSQLAMEAFGSIENMLYEEYGVFDLDEGDDSYSEVDNSYRVVRKFFFTTKDTDNELESIDNVVFPLLSQREWYLFIAEEGASGFVCSDHPIALISIGDPPENPDHPYNIEAPGLAQRYTELTLPLNRRMALFSTFETLPDVHTVDDKVIADVNIRTILSAARQIYCSNLDFKFLDNGVMRSGKELVDP